MLDENPSFRMSVVVNVDAGEAKGGEEREARLHVIEKVAPFPPSPNLALFFDLSTSPQEAVSHP